MSINYFSTFNGEMFSIVSSITFKVLFNVIIPFIASALSSFFISLLSCMNEINVVPSSSR